MMVAGPAHSARPPWPQWNDSGFDEAEKTLRWRYSEFRGMDFEHDEARLLAESDVDLHRMANMLRDGCAHTLAVHILT